MGGIKGLPLADRFWSKVDKSGGPDACWPWLRRLTPKGYGQFQLDVRKSVRAHRLAWELDRRVAPPPHLAVCHDCDNPKCCNPNHLWLGTQLQNIEDRDAKGRTARGDRVGDSDRRARGTANAKSKLTEGCVRQIRARSSDGATHAELAREYGVSENSIRKVVNRRSWSHVE